MRVGTVKPEGAMTARRHARGGARATRALAALAIAIALAGGPHLLKASAAPATSITVYASAALTDAFAVLGKVFEQRMPEAHVTFNFAGSQQLALQIEQGAPADVFASTEPQWMTYLQQRGRIVGGP